VIINADDFGLSRSTNQAILRAFEEGLISSTTLMANMPAFAEAAALACERGLVAHVGIHFVMTEGQPLTDPIRRCTRFCDSSGRFVSWWRGPRVLWLGSAERGAVAIELRAQIDRCRQHGVPLTHLDSHHHVHHALGLLPVVLRVARQSGIPAVRTMASGLPDMSLQRRVNAALVNGQIRAAGRAATRYFCDIQRFLQYERELSLDRGADSIEIMTHPLLGDDGRVLERSPDHSLPDLVRRVPGYERAVSYSGRRYAAA
jgi:predicted glycoside hydrolase/deacetylase ChbG (UPF0249 family)